jgi:hypothetical protein
MRQIEDSWKINHLNPPNEFEVLENIHSKNSLSSEDHQELNNYRKSLFKNLINKKCSSICMPSKDLYFKTCFDNCEAKIQIADNVLELSKKEYAKFKFTQSFV